MTNGSHSSLPVSTAVVHQSIIQSDLTRAKSLNTHTNNPTTTTTTIDSNHSSDSSTSPETNHPQPEQHQPEANRVDPDCQPDLLVSQQPSDSVLPSTGEHQISGNCESINQIQTHYNHPSNINSNLLRTSPLNSDSETVSLVLSLSRGGTFREEGDEPDDEEEEETETLTSSNDNHNLQLINHPSNQNQNQNQHQHQQHQHQHQLQQNSSSSTLTSSNSSHSSPSSSSNTSSISSQPQQSTIDSSASNTIQQPSLDLPTSSNSSTLPELQPKHLQHHQQQQQYSHNLSITKHPSPGTYHHPNPLSPSPLASSSSSPSPSSSSNQIHLHSAPPHAETSLSLQTTVSSTIDSQNHRLTATTTNEKTHPDSQDSVHTQSPDHSPGSQTNGLGDRTLSPDRSVDQPQQQQPSPASLILTNPKTLNQRPPSVTIPNPIKVSLTPPLDSKDTSHNQDQKLQYPFNLISPRTASNNTDLSRHPSLDNTRQMANAAFATETANSPAPVLETPSGNDYSNHATFDPSFDPRAPNQSSAPRPSSSRVPDNSQPYNETRRSPRDSTLLSPTKPPSTSSNRPNMSNPNSSRTRRHLGEYTLGKTLGAGSMGKVKLAVSTITGEKIAIKIIPRHTSLIAVQQQVDKNKENDRAAESSNHKDPSFIEKAKAKDISKEVRTIREASIDLLLHHPYICGLKSMLVYPNHYYMLFEYVNGGQMLDYIISHGRLRERAARRFARQMGSALEYCHANSIVHRDLKIENILISKTGNIKIIDFGLSNLFSPNSNLQTFCGSLYFAAPELLNAKVYIGPEVDVWSFGIVLFVLVCGKVPFDDQSMPALHAKIKRGQVEYPSWLSSECKHLLSRMLVTNPANRATLHEVLNHAWMVKGYEGAPDPHIPPREPLRLNQIDPEIVKSMTGFEFGTIEKIEADLKAVLSSEIYLTVLKFYDDRRATGNGGSVEPIYRNAQNGSGSSMPALTAGIKKDQQRGDRDLPKSTGKASKRFSGFGFYSKRMAGGLAAVFNTVGGSKNEERGSTPDPANQASAGFETVLLNGQTLDSMDPTRGFHPLISVYFLVREKIEREKIYGPGVFASSTVSLTGPPPPPAPPSAYKSSLSPAGLDYNKTTYESHLNGRSPAKNRTKDPGSQFSHHPQRDQASLLLDLHQGDLNSQRPRSRFLPPRPSTATERMVSTPSASLPNSPVKSFNASKNSNSAQNDEAISARRSVHIIPSSQSPGISQQMDEAYLPPKSHRSGLGLGCNGAGNAGRGDRVVSMIETGQQPPSLASPESERSPSFAKRFGSFLGRPTSVAEPDYKRHRPRSSIGGSAHKIGNKTPLSPLPQVAESTTSGSVEPISPGELQQQQQQQGSLGGSPEQGEEGGQAHERVPMSAPVKGSRRPRVTSLQDSNQRPKATTGNICTPAESEEDEDDETQGLEEEESQMIDIQNEESDRPLPSGSRQVEFFGRTAPPSRSGDKIKPIYLKGLFSVATTTTRGPKALREDLVTVLDRIGVQHREIKGGLECVHVPSIDLSSVRNSGGGQGISGGKRTPGSIVKKKVSSARFSATSDKNRKGNDNRSEESGSQADGDITGPTTPPSGGVVTPQSAVGDHEENKSSRFLSPTGVNMMNHKKYDLVVRFEIFIVKMPLLPGIHGLQFRRISGNAWQYHTFARRILQELKL